MLLLFSLLHFFFNDTATTEIYTLSLHDALPISPCRAGSAAPCFPGAVPRGPCPAPSGLPCTASTTLRPPCTPACRNRSAGSRDRKSTRLNSSHVEISYAVFCLKKKKKKRNINRT